jgi:hypothetical protein
MYVGTAATAVHGAQAPSGVALPTFQPILFVSNADVLDGWRAPTTDLPVSPCVLCGEFKKDIHSQHL